MRLAYRILGELFLLISPIIILYRIIKGKENIYRFPERYSINSENRIRGKLIWFHCSSVGELLSIIPIIEKLELNSKKSYKNVGNLQITCQEKIKKNKR